MEKIRTEKEKKGPEALGAGLMQPDREKKSKAHSIMPASATQAIRTARAASLLGQNEVRQGGNGMLSGKFPAHRRPQIRAGAEPNRFRSRPVISAPVSCPVLFFPANTGTDGQRDTVAGRDGKIPSCFHPSGKRPRVQIINLYSVL